MVLAVPFVIMEVAFAAEELSAVLELLTMEVVLAFAAEVLEAEFFPELMEEALVVLFLWPAAPAPPPALLELEAAAPLAETVNCADVRPCILSKKIHSRT